jgi:hypothetical protein
MLKIVSGLISCIGIATFLLFDGQPSALAYQDTKAIKIEKLYPYETVTPGQILTLTVAGVSEEIALNKTELPLTDFKIEIIQDNKRVSSPVRGAYSVLRYDKATSTTKPGISVIFLLPQGLREADAELVLSYKTISASTKLTIVNRPLPPTIETRITSLDMTTPPPQVKGSTPPQYKFEKGRLEHLYLSPLVDPEGKESGILVTFKQGKEVYPTTAKIKYIPATESIGNEFRLNATSRYETSVVIPAELLPGEAVMEVQTKINGLISEPASMTVQISDRSKPEEALKLATPRILGLSKKRVGIGQSIDLLVEKRTQLEPDPAKTTVILDQAGERHRLRPENNSATFSGTARRLPNEPVMLRVRIPTNLSGEYKIMVFNPALGEEHGLSDGIPLEIVNKILPPSSVVIRESTNEDVEPLRRMREASIKAGREFRDYDPENRYLTIQANDLEMHPQNLFVQLQWEEKTYQLKFEDYSLATQMWIVFRLPDDVKTGQLQVSVANRTAGGQSETVTQTVEITKLPKK